MSLSRMELLNLQLPYLIILLQIHDILKAMRNLAGQECGPTVHRAIGHKALEHLVAVVIGDVLVDEGRAARKTTLQEGSSQFQR